MSDLSKDVIRNFIVQNFLFGDATQPIPEDTSLIETDLMDSTGVLELVGFIEEAFGITIADAEIVPANLDSIAAIRAFIASKTAVAAA